MTTNHQFNDSLQSGATLTSEQRNQQLEIVMDSQTFLGPYPTLSVEIILKTGMIE